MPEPLSFLSILIVEDDPTNRILLRGLLEREGHSVVEAADGQEGVEKFQAEAPDMVLMDLLMPRMDGYEATRQIKERSGDAFVPVILLTAVTDEESLAWGVDCGADDFLNKPYNAAIIQAKLAAFSRILHLNRMVSSQNELLQQHNQRLQREHHLAEEVLAASAPDPSPEEFPNLNWHSAPKEVSNGDLLLAARGPEGHQYILVGDLTGHGLSAAVGALPVSDVFYREAGQGASLEEIASEVDRRLRAHLPVGFFMACAFIEMDPESGQAGVINAGLPELLVRYSSGEIETLASRFMPLGPVGERRQALCPQRLDLGPDDRLLAFSDGLTEAVSPTGERFGPDRVTHALQESGKDDTLLDRLLEDLEGFREGAPQEDDLTVAEVWPLSGQEVRESLPELDCGKPLRRVWRLDLRLGPEALAWVDPIPGVVSALSHLEPLEEHRSYLFTLLSELYNNALEHGVLGLDGSQKQDEEGFSQFYNKREEFLRNLKEGWIRMGLEVRRQRNAGKLYLTVEDSGGGFDPHCATGPLEGNLSLGGRGIALVRSICEEVAFLGRGNRVEAVYPF